MEKIYEYNGYLYGTESEAQTDLDKINNYYRGILSPELSWTQYISIVTSPNKENKFWIHWTKSIEVVLGSPVKQEVIVIES